MENKIVILLKKREKLFFVIKSVFFLTKSSFGEVDGSKKKYPKIIQLPITYKCNSRCVMCNIWRMDHSNEASVEEFTKFIQDSIFKKVGTVGINGGEPSLIPNLPEYAKEILKLPKIRSLNIISNGFSQKPFLNSVEEIYKMCCEKGVKFHISISLDGVGEIHNIVRGRSNVFEKTISTVDEIVKNQHKYCDSYNVGCTIVNQNVDFLIELDTFAKSKNYNIKYRLGVDNKRIESYELRDQYSVIYSSLRQSAKEFLHYQMSQEKKLTEKFKYFSFYYWLNSNKPRRLLGCVWKDEGVTLDGKGELYYCAVASDSIGSLRIEKGEEIFFNDANIEYRKDIIKNSCDRCIHDYSGKIKLSNLIFFFRELVLQRINMKIYRLKALFL